MRIVLILVALALVAGWAGGEVHDNGDGTATDSSTSLQWTRQGNGEDINFTDASDFCESLDLAGFEDWRLPSLEEARTLFRDVHDLLVYEKRS